SPSRPSCPTCSSCPSCPSRPTCPVSLSLSATISLRIPNRMRRVGRPRSLVDADRAEAPGLEDPDELQANHLEQRKKRDDEAAAVLDVGEEILAHARVVLGQAAREL